MREALIWTDDLSYLWKIQENLIMNYLCIPPIPSKSKPSVNFSPLNLIPRWLCKFPSNPIFLIPLLPNLTTVLLVTPFVNCSPTSHPASNPSLNSPVTALFSWRCDSQCSLQNVSCHTPCMPYSILQGLKMVYLLVSHFSIQIICYISKTKNSFKLCH